MTLAKTGANLAVGLGATALALHGLKAVKQSFPKSPKRGKPAPKFSMKKANRNLFGLGVGTLVGLTLLKSSADVAAGIE